MSTLLSQDWTSGPAKWAAVAVLGAASIGGMLWSNLRGPTVVNWVPVSARSAAQPGKPQSPTNVTDVEQGAKDPASKGSSDKSVTPPTTLDINKASAVEFELLPDIGPALAKRIVDYRDQHGAFKSIEALREVKGIGPKTLSKIRSYLTVQ